VKILAVRSIPLADDTVAAWREAAKLCDIELRFLRRDDEAVSRLYKYAPNYGAVLNLGNTAFNDRRVDSVVFNPPEVVKTLNSPRAIRLSPLSIMLPPAVKLGGIPVHEKVWFKDKGFHDDNKEFFEKVDDYRLMRMATETCDFQKHIDGTVYRIVTVGDRVVQASINRDREYQWVGVNDLPRVLKLASKYAVSLLPEKNRTFIGWDFIMETDDDVYLLEGNTSPGVNVATAERILKAMRTNLSDGLLRQHFVRADMPRPVFHFEPPGVDGAPDHDVNFIEPPAWLNVVERVANEEEMGTNGAIREILDQARRERERPGRFTEFGR